MFGCRKVQILKVSVELTALLLLSTSSSAPPPPPPPAGHTGRLLQSLCFTSMSFLLLHIIYQITVNSLLAGNSITSDFNCESSVEPQSFKLSSQRKRSVVYCSDVGGCADPKPEPSPLASASHPVHARVLKEYKNIAWP